MKVGFVGCGSNSDYHINFAKDYPGVDIVGVVDKDEARARTCATRHEIKNTYSSVADLVRDQKPDVLHIITPPETHLAVASEAIELNCHVIVEKPLTPSAAEARELYDLADRHGVMLCAMHNHFFDPCMLKARQLIEAGKVGQIVHVDSHYGMNSRTDVFRKYPAPNVVPWLYQLPGGIYHDFLAHPLYVMLPFLGRVEQVEAMEESFGELPRGLSDELRLLVKGEKALGHLVLSFAARPHHHYVRIHGTKMMVHVDFNTMTTTTYPVSSLPKAAQKATYNLTGSRQLFFGTVSNVWNFLRKKLRPYQGMQILIHKFYDAVAGKGELPVSREEGLEVVEVMDAVWSKTAGSKLNHEPIVPAPRGNEPLVLVTGATGFVGRRLVDTLVRDGYRVRALARKLSNIEPLRKDNVEICFGDVACKESLEPAFDGADYVVHAAADTGGEEEEGRLSTVQGTRNVVDLCRRFGVKKLVYISSCSVFGYSDYRRGQTVTEESSLERFPKKRGAYSLCKLEAEKIVTEAIENEAIPAVCLRPGLIYGPGGDMFNAMLGFSLADKLYLVIGLGGFVLPLVYVDNLCSAVVAAMPRQESTGKTYNVVDPEKVTKRRYMNRLIKRLHPKARVAYVPYSFLYTAVLFQELLFGALRRRPILTRYRLTSSQKPVVFDASRIMNDLDWRPPHNSQQAFDTLIHESA